MVFTSVRHDWRIVQCDVHKNSPMYFMACSCGIHSQCWQDRATAEHMAEEHIVDYTTPDDWR